MNLVVRQIVSIPTPLGGRFFVRQKSHFTNRLALVIAITPILAVFAPVVAGNMAGQLAGDAQSNSLLQERQIDEWVRALGDPSYQKRVEATRRLCTIGPQASEALKRAAEGAEPEIALRAGKLLVVFDRLLFSGVEIAVRFSKQRVTWDEPVDLIVMMANRSGYVALLPIEILAAGSDSPDNNHARQVANMIDLADWLVVRTADGRQLELHADDINADPAVSDVIQQRLDHSPISLLSPGDSVTLTLKAFNRGWARYRMLDAGRFTVELQYLPQWDDEELLAQRVGAVKSNMASLEVSSSAPPTVSRSGRELSVKLKVQGDTVTALLTNHRDRTVHINTHFGSGVPFAKGIWIAVSGEIRHEIPVLPVLPSQWQQFDRSLLVQIPPGGSAVLAKTTWTKLRRRFTEVGADHTRRRWTVAFTYGNFLNRKWQRRQSDVGPLPPSLRNTLPLWIPAARVTSDAMHAPRNPGR